MVGGPDNSNRDCEDDDFDDDQNRGNGDDSELSSNDLDLPAKKKRVRDRSNKAEKNWTMAMKRHWNTPQKDKAMAQITFKRTELHTVHVQMDLLLNNIFPIGKKNKKADPENWMCKITNLMGGLEYQHLHADQG
jgi:hypothetical protein